MTESILLYASGPAGLIPSRSHTGDAGLDLFYSGPGCIVWPFQTKDLETGWDIKVPDGYWGSIKARSSTLYKKKLLVLEGVIDASYTGPLSVVVFNPTLVPREILHHDRLAQLLVLPVAYPGINFVDKMPHTHRNGKGFGSTGD